MAWTTAPEVFLIDVSVSDSYVIEFISKGVFELTVADKKSTQQT